MTRRLTTVALLAALEAVVCFLSACAAAAPPPLGWATNCEVTDVVDGDTVTVSITTHVRVRLTNCWAAELNTQEGKSAKRYIESLSIGKPAVLFVPHGRRQLGDSTTMGRVLGQIWLEGFDESLSELMVEAGYATKTKGK
jgi:endonuclease YncB( thermonuclease family)